MPLPGPESRVFAQIARTAKYKATCVKRLAGVFEVRLSSSDYYDRIDANQWHALKNMPFKLFRVADSSQEITNNDVYYSSNQYRRGYWYTDDNGGYDFSLQSGNYEVELKSVDVQVGTNVVGGETRLSVNRIEHGTPETTRRFSCSVSPPIHMLENPLRHTPLYKDVKAITMCASLTTDPNAVISARADAVINQQGDRDTIKRFQELLNWIGFYRTYTAGESGGLLDGDYVGGATTGVKEVQEILNAYLDANPNYPSDLPRPANPPDGRNADGLTVLTMATCYRDSDPDHNRAIRRRRVGEPGNQGTKVLTRVLDSFNIQGRLREDAAWNFHQFLEEVECKGGELDFLSGTLRDLGAQVGPGMRTTSLHHTGRALDFNINRGMTHNPNDDLYVIEKDNTDPNWANPREHRGQWIVWIKCVNQDGTQGVNKSLNAWVHSARTRGGGQARSINGWFINLTEIAGRHSIERISARAGWENNYMNCEWWHFQYEGGLRGSNWGNQMNDIGYTNRELERQQGWQVAGNPNPNVYNNNDLAQTPW
jgi:hypothetical protein